MSDAGTVTLAEGLDPDERRDAGSCSIARAVEIVNSRSAFLLLREAFYGTTRFDDFARRVGISDPVAAGRLKSLVDAGLLERRPYQAPGERTRLDYHLTEKGADFFPVLVSLMQWGNRWQGPARASMRHHDCGGTVRAELRCEHGHPLAAGDIEVVAEAQ